MQAPEFSSLKRQQFRRFFQPSRIVMALLRDHSQDGWNVITLCFDMYCSYKPAMMAFAVHRRAYSHGILQDATECVLSIPGERLAEQAMYCGTYSGADKKKFVNCGFTPTVSSQVSVPGIAEAIANVELRLVNRVRTGDHLTVFGQVLTFGVNQANDERSLISVGPRTYGYQVLVRRGVHRIAVVDGPTESARIV
jgi:flavin reductase (DIM6/NTAB) family NADH-FMN oxidoreductase RutF